jgi:hypothetical protein
VGALWGHVEPVACRISFQSGAFSLSKITQPANLYWLGGRRPHFAIQTLKKKTFGARAIHWWQSNVLGLCASLCVLNHVRTGMCYCFSADWAPCWRKAGIHLALVGRWKRCYADWTTSHQRTQRRYDVMTGRGLAQPELRACHCQVARRTTVRNAVV